MTSEKRQRVLLVAALVVADGLAVMAGLLLAWYVRIGSGILPYTTWYSLATYVKMSLVATPLWLLVFTAGHLYRYDSLLSGLGEYASVVRGCIYGTVGLIVLSFFERTAGFSRGWLLISLGTTTCLVVTMRFVVRRIVIGQRRRGRFVSRAIIVGANEQAIALARQLDPAASSGIEVVGFVDDFLPIDTPVFGRHRVLASPGSLPALIEEEGISEIIVVPQATAWESFQEILLADQRAKNGVRVRILPGLYELLTTGVRVDHKAFVPLLTPERARITGADALLKLLLDSMLVIIGAVVWLPVLTLVVVTKRATSAEPVFRRELVLGQFGRVFPAPTVRVDPTACAGGQGHPGAAQSLDCLLLRTGFFRMPQLVRILTGQMSLVGPRPIHVDDQAAHRWLPSLLTVKPGITGPWVMAGSGPHWPEEESLRDMYYIRNWTLWLDLQILFRTIGVVLTGSRPLDRQV